MVKRRILQTSVIAISVLALLFVFGFQNSVIAAEKESKAPATAAEKSKNVPAVEKSKDVVKIKTGDVAPAFDLTDQNGNKVNLNSFAGKKLLVYFYPKANSSGCTKQACILRDTMAELTKIGINVIGISPDKPEVQKKFAEKNKLTFTLLSDPDHKVAESYGVWKERMVKGKPTSSITRSSFIVGEDGKILNAWYKIKPEETTKLAIEALTKK